MSHTNRNFIIAYILLVALPIVGLVGILKSGRALAAPISIDGVWQLQADPVQLAALPCQKALAYGSDTSLAISQSGKNFSLTLNNGSRLTASGAIEGTTLTASLNSAAAPTAENGVCGQSGELLLVATVNPKTDPRSLAGTLSVNNCPVCVPVKFSAVRVTPPKKGSL